MRFLLPAVAGGTTGCASANGAPALELEPELATGASLVWCMGRAGAAGAVGRADKAAETEEAEEAEAILMGGADRDSALSRAAA